MNSKYQTYRSNPKLNNYIKLLTNEVLRDPKFRKGNVYQQDHSFWLDTDSKTTSTSNYNR